SRDKRPSAVSGRAAPSPKANIAAATSPRSRPCAARIDAAPSVGPTQGLRLRRSACPCAFLESLQWLEVIHHSRNKLRHRGMNVHRALHHCVGRLGVHNIENAMDDLVTCESEEGGAQYLFAISIHEYFHETLCLAFLICAAAIFHSQCGNQRGLASLADFRFCHPPATKWGIGVERVSSDAVAHAPLIVVEKVGRHDLEIIPRRVRERASAIAVA